MLPPPIGMLAILRKGKWVLYWVQVVLQFGLGRLVRLTRREPRRVALLGELHYSGGTFVYLRMLVELLRAEGFEISVLLARKFVRPQLLDYARARNVRLVVLPDFFAFVEVLAALWHVLALRVSLVVVSSGAPGRHTFALLWDVPSIHIIHSVPGANHNARMRRLISVFLREPHTMVGVSRATRDSMRRHFRVPRRRHQLVKLVYNGVPDLGYAYGSVSSGPCRIVTVGHVVDYKNPRIWLMAARTVITASKTPVEFTWVGDGPQLAELQRETDGEQAISFVGYSSEVESALRAACVYYQPSRTESFGLSVAEAMSIGLPCVVSDRGGLPELVADEENGYVCDCEDVLAQSQALVRLVENVELRERMSKESRRRYLRLFSYERWRFEMTSLISECTRRPRSRV
jgi:glycosyltransferase involved in cell wall biosynthesis